MGRRGVDVIAKFHAVLAVVSFMTGSTNAEETLRQDRVYAIPQHQRKAEILEAIGKPADATVFAPAIGTGTRGPRIAMIA